MVEFVVGQCHLQVSIWQGPGGWIKWGFDGPINPASFDSLIIKLITPIPSLHSPGIWYLLLLIYLSKEGEGTVSVGLTLFTILKYLWPYRPRNKFGPFCLIISTFIQVINLCNREMAKNPVHPMQVELWPVIHVLPGSKHSNRGSMMMSYI